MPGFLPMVGVALHDHRARPVVGTPATPDSLYVTHDQVEAMTLADRLVVMNGGVAEQIDTPMAVYERPASRFVAGFIGSPGMNFLSATVDAAVGSVRGNGGPVRDGRSRHRSNVVDYPSASHLARSSLNTWQSPLSSN